MITSHWKAANTCRDRTYWWIVVVSRGSWQWQSPIHHSSLQNMAAAAPGAAGPPGVATAGQGSAICAVCHDPFKVWGVLDDAPATTTSCQALCCQAVRWVFPAQVLQSCCRSRLGPVAMS